MTAGRYLIDDEGILCQHCGASVGNQRVHDRWHDEADRRSAEVDTLAGLVDRLTVRYYQALADDACAEQLQLQALATRETNLAGVAAAKAALATSAEMLASLAAADAREA